MKSVRGSKRSRKGSVVGVHIEGLESRRLLASVQLGNALIFDNTDATNGTELWISDLDGSNAALVKDIRQGVSGSSPQELFAFDGLVYFSAQNGSPGIGRELWRTDGTEAGTVLVKDIYSGGSSSNPHDFMVINDRLVFLATWSGITPQLYVTDGTTGGTIKLFSNPFPSTIHNLEIGSDGLLHWEASDQNSSGLVPWVTDGTLAGTKRVYGQIEDSVSVNERILHVRGTGADDIITLSSTAGVTTVTVNGVDETFNEADFSSILVESLRNDDLIDLSDGPNMPATIQGGDDDDTLIGGAGDDVLDGGEGSDLLDGGAGTNTADYSARTTAFTGGSTLSTIGGEADQLINLQTLLTGSGDDVLNVISGNQDGIRYVDAGAGNDSVTMQRWYDSATVHGGDGNDDILIKNYGGLGIYFGDAGDDILRVYRSSATDRDFYGGEGTDTLDYSAFNWAYSNTKITLDDIANDGSGGEYLHPFKDNVHSDIEVIIGTAGNDSIVGTSKDETIHGGNGHDTLFGGGGNDLIDANGINGNITFRLQGGLLSIVGTSSADGITVRLGLAGLEASGAFRTKVFDASAVQSLFVDSGDGDDLVRIEGLGIASRTYLRSGNDTFVGGTGADRVYGGDGNDWMSGGLGNDTMYGEAGSDRLFGGAGRDYLDGGAGADVLRGEGDQDRIIAKSGEDDFRGNVGDVLNLL